MTWLIWSVLIFRAVHSVYQIHVSCEKGTCHIGDGSGELAILAVLPWPSLLHTQYVELEELQPYLWFC